MKEKPLYITTTLPYVNADPHIGFALELVQADVLARWHKMQGRDVYFNTGTDEHGTKIYKKSVEEGKDIKVYVDEYAQKFRELKEKLNIDSGLHFIRTTDEKHVHAAEEMWKRCFAKGDIYKKKYKGLYCVADEAFVREADLINGRCPNHPTLELQEIEEENYFFNFSNYKEKLRKYLKEGTVVPEWRRVEALKLVDEIEDFSISREKSRLPWGVPVPGDDSQVMYVWFDALTSYISTLGWPEGNDFKKYWEEGETLQLAGKDQVKFQSVIWQAMLLSAEVKNTDQIFYHGFINSGGQKMSKSLGNVISPDNLISRYGVDGTRIMLLGVNQFEDTNVNIGIKGEGFDLTYDGNLANGLGNLVSRIMTLAQAHLPDPVQFEHSVFDKVADALNHFEIQKAVNILWSEVSGLDAIIQSEKPWETKDKETITNLVVNLAKIANTLSPFMPSASEKIIESIKQNKKPVNLFPRLNA